MDRLASSEPFAESAVFDRWAFGLGESGNWVMSMQEVRHQVRNHLRPFLLRSLV